MKLKKIITAVLALIMTVMVSASLVGCGTSNRIMIWTSGEDYKNNYYLTELRKEFPDYEIELEYMNSSTIAAKVVAEGDNCTADIIASEEYGYLYKCEEYLAELTDFDYSEFLPEIVPENHKFTPELKNGGCVILNPSVLESNNLPEPTSYNDLLDPKYKDLICMPNPASSGTGYMFLRQLTNEWGENEAFGWFKQFKANVLQFTSSGSGPVNKLKAGEIAIGLGMTGQAITEINEGVNLKVVFFAEGSPYSMYGNAVLRKSSSRPEVMEVFNYLSTVLCKGNNERYFPDRIYKDFAPEVDGYPKDIDYGDMSNDTQEEKERLLKKWNDEGIA